MPVVSSAEETYQFSIILTKLHQHLLGVDEFIVIITQALMAPNIANRTEGGPADSPSAFRNGISHGKNLLRMLVQQEPSTRVVDHDVCWVPPIQQGLLDVSTFGNAPRALPWEYEQMILLGSHVTFDPVIEAVGRLARKAPL